MKKTIKTSLVSVFLLHTSHLFSLGIVVRSEFPTTVTVTLSNDKKITQRIEESSSLVLAKLPSSHSPSPNQLAIDAFFKGLYISFKHIEWQGIDGKIYKVNFDPLGTAGGILGGILDFIPTGTGFVWETWYDAIISKDNKVHITTEKDNKHFKTLTGE